MTGTPGACRIVVASPLEEEHVRRIAATFPAVDIFWAPALLPVPRYPADHNGAPFSRPPDDEARWRSALAVADVLFDFDRSNAEALPDLAPRVRWIQATSAGIGATMVANRYSERMPQCVFTTAAGVHAIPLAEFCMMAMYAHSRNLLLMLRGQAGRHWERFAGGDLAGCTLGIVGMGAIGREVARRARHAGMRVLGTRRRVAGARPEELNVDELLEPGDLDRVLPRLDYLVLAAPGTAETRHMIGVRQLERLPRSAFLINVARGSVIDEAALIHALQTGRLAGAALDVFEEEPLPAASPLWSLPNVIISPHSASTSHRENARITDLFCDNLDRFLRGAPLRNVYQPERAY